MNTKLLSCLLLFSILFSCGQNNRKVEFSNTRSSDETKGETSNWATDSVAVAESETSIKSSLAESKPEANHFNTAVGLVLKDSSRKIIRTADIRFEVKNLLTASKVMENTTLSLNGFVLNTHVTAENESEDRKPISKDSVLIVKSFNQVNRLTVRVPTHQLSTFLEAIFPLVHYLNYRKINGEDVTLDILAGKAKANRLDHFTNRTRKHIDGKAKKLPESTHAESDLLDRQMQVDAVRFEILSLGDRLEYSTLHLEIYQPEMTVSTMVLNVKETKIYEPGFFSKLRTAISSGWNLLLSVVLFLAEIWSLLLIGLVVALIWIKFRKKGSKVSVDSNSGE